MSVTITPKRQGNIYSLTITGHAHGDDISCARVSTAFQILYNLLGKDIISHISKPGYSFLSSYINPHNHHTIHLTTLYLEALASTHQNTLNYKGDHYHG